MNVYRKYRKQPKKIIERFYKQTKFYSIIFTSELNRK